MEYDFTLTESWNGSIVLNELNSGYSLVFYKVIHNEGEKIKVGLNHPIERALQLTSRDLSFYVRTFPELREVNPKFQYVEVGAGLGGWITSLIDKIGKNSPKPIVIDMADYRLIQAMLRYSKTLDLGLHQERLDILCDRVDSYLSDDRIRLINLSLGEALESEKSLNGCADVVVDCCGAVSYPLTEPVGDQLTDRNKLRRSVLELENKLLKPTGSFFHKLID